MKSLRAFSFLAAFSFCLLSASAEAALFRSYLSVSGNDANPCTLPLPCRLLPAALAAVNDGGEIWMLNSANYNTGPVTIDKSVTILAVPGALGSVVASGGSALSITGVGSEVSLRNLNILNLGGGTSGIVWSNGARLTIEDCEIYGMPQSGILTLASNAKLVVKDTVIRNNGDSGIMLENPLVAAISNVHLLHNGFAGLLVGSSSSATVTDSVFAGNTNYGVLAQSVFGGETRVIVERSIVRGSAIGLSVFSNSSIGSRTNLVSRQNTLTDNDIGLYVSTNTGTTSTAVIDGTVFVNNNYGIYMLGAGTPVVQTRGNNTFQFNATQDIAGGSFSPFVTQ